MDNRAREICGQDWLILITDALARKHFRPAVQSGKP